MSPALVAFSTQPNAVAAEGPADEVMTMTTLEEIEAELARQDEELERASAAFEDAAAHNARFDVPHAFFDELAEACSPRPVVSHLPLGALRA